MTGIASHPFAGAWNHNAHYYPQLARLVAGARTVVDVGCGEGTFARHLARPGRVVLGVDVDVAALRLARAGGFHAAGAGGVTCAGGAEGAAVGAGAAGRAGADPRDDRPTGADPVAWCAGSAEALPVATGSVDALTMVMVLHHVDAEAALAEVRRVLRPGGTAVVLGYGRSAVPRDAPAELRDLLTHRYLSRRTAPWEPPVGLAQPDRTWAEARRCLRAGLPGGRWRRLPLWRYRYVWRAPGAA